MALTNADILAAFDGAAEGTVIRKGAGDTLEAVEAQTSSFGTDVAVFAYKDGAGVWQSKTKLEMQTLLEIGVGTGLTGVEALRVASASQFATQDRPRVNVLAQANAWHSDDEGWMLPLSGSPRVRRPIIAGHVPKHSMVNGAFIEISIIGEAFDNANFSIAVNIDPNVDSSVAWAAGLLFESGSFTAGVGLFDYRIRIYNCGRNKTVFFGYGVRQGAGINNPYHCHAFGMEDSQNATGASVAIDDAKDFVNGDQISFRDGQLGTGGGDTWQFEFRSSGSGSADEDVACGVSNEDTLQNLATAIHQSRLRLKCDLEDLGGSWRLNIETIMGGTHYSTSGTQGEPELVLDVDSGGVATASDFAVAQADDGLLDWMAGQDLYVSAKKIGVGGVNIYAASMIQFGATRGWEPRV